MAKKKTTARVIGYIKPELRQEEKQIATKIEVAVKKEEPEVKKEQPLPNLTTLTDIQKTKSVKIVKWINEHKEFKWGVMCTKLKIDRGNFQRLLKNKEPLIKVELIPQIELFLKQYGYAE